MRFGSRIVRKRKNIKKFFIIGIIIALIPVFIIVNARFKPVIRAACNSRGEILTTQAVNSAASEILSENKDTYSSLIKMEKMSDGRIASLTTNSAAVNAMKAQMSLRIQEALLELGRQDVRIPLGSVIGGGILIGRGPKIKVKLRPLNSVTTDFESNFSDAGINQTRHSVILRVTVRVQVLAAGYEDSVEVSTGFIVAESVIVGDVPTTLADIF